LRLWDGSGDHAVRPFGQGRLDISLDECCDEAIRPSLMVTCAFICGLTIICSTEHANQHILDFWKYPIPRCFIGTRRELSLDKSVYLRMLSQTERVKPRTTRALIDDVPPAVPTGPCDKCGGCRRQPSQCWRAQTYLI
jgi:hypothetical protein